MLTGAGSLVSMRNLAASCGVLAGIGGFVHGVGEVAQGRGAPDEIVIDSWTSGRIAENLGGEPAMTLMPDLVITGLSAMTVSIAVVIWAGWFVDRRFGGTGLGLLSVLMLLFGGGFGPPMLGLLSALVAGCANWGRRHELSGRLADHRSPRLASAWSALFWLCLLNASFLVLGSLMAAVLFDLRIPDAFVYSLFLAVVSMPIAAAAGLTHEREGAR